MTRTVAVAFVLVHIFSVFAEENPREEKENISSDRSQYGRALARDCDKIYSTTCLKLDVISWVDKLSEAENYTVIPGVSIVRENATRAPNTAEIVADLARDFPGDPEARLDVFLMRKVQGFLGSHVVKVNLLGEESTDMARKGGGGGGGGGKKGGGGMGYILAAAAMMKGTMMALALGGLAAMAGKALMTGMISLMLSAIIGLKSLSSGGQKTTYEVIAKPHYTQAQSYSTSHEDYAAAGHGGGHSGYGRSFDLPLPLSLQPGYAPQ
ncbi:unnamed protein product [Phaedon cochleariae]|uniref:Osiris 16 n=1 Tax=Phaedon cochleariae TaxID=80249 RepID=A0A9N9SF68_PHACE|nr:unnamed protein product [Phaedon cochleariae]